MNSVILGRRQFLANSQRRRHGAIVWMVSRGQVPDPSISDRVSGSSFTEHWGWEVKKAEVVGLRLRSSNVSYIARVAKGCGARTTSGGTPRPYKQQSQGVEGSRFCDYFGKKVKGSKAASIWLPWTSSDSVTPH